MSEMFDGYERQYCELSTNLSRKCTSAASALNGEEKQQKLAELKTGMEEAESLIRRMDLEARTLLPKEKATLLAKLREYKSDLNMLKREVKKSATAIDPPLSMRDDLLDTGLHDNPLKTTNDQRNRLVMSTTRLAQSGDRIKESKRQMIETEELGVSILQDLHQQRQTLLNTQNTLLSVDDSVGKSRHILGSMNQRMSQHKWIIVTVIAVLFLAIALIVYVKMHSKRS
ncbi:unnamed protein product [Sphagnum jensenii]|jgi:vesicle transport through interaction with t-SNAREs protein 1|uniref:Vesicle transport v-SNARE N-terminal domain-containing protein n=1 Tax=Sphagnum jensenii TaxID=128206 RepID=A0ABP0WXZ6_9BRYO